MEEDQEYKYTCKLCNKGFNSSKSLGGHMKGHVVMNSPKNNEKINGTNMGFEASGHVGYVLRENPKKSWRFSNSNHIASKLVNQCKVCGKEFETVRALSGHMRHHSPPKGKEWNLCKECGKGFGSLKALFGHMRCHSETTRVVNQPDDEVAGVIRRKRSRTVRYQFTANSSFCNLNVSLSVAWTDQELVEAAVTLMMLSRDVGNWGGFGSTSEYSDDGNSVDLEAKSWHQSGQSMENEIENVERTGGETLKMNRLDSCILNCGDALFGEELTEFGDSDYGITSNGEKKVELEVPLDRFTRGGELTKVALEEETEIELFDAEKEKKLRDKIKIEAAEEGLGENLMKEAGMDQAGSVSKESKSRKKARSDVYDPELGKNSCNVTKCTPDSKAFDDSRKKAKYQCKTCNKVFHSHQALGGHRASHRTIRCSSELKVESSDKGSKCPNIEANCELLKLESDNNSVNQEVGGATVISHELKKSKVHECTICLKSFKSGQALGGHMGSHFVGNTEVSIEQTIIKQGHPDVHDLFNLDVPHTLEQEANGMTGFEPFWIGSDHKREPLVGLISS